MPYFKQDLAFKMIKITDLNHECWNLTDSVQGAYGYILGMEPNFHLPSGIRVNLERKKIRSKSLALVRKGTLQERAEELGAIPTHLAHLKLE